VEDTEKHGDTRYELPGVLRPKLDWSVEALNGRKAEVSVSSK
jgi:hypothetical protein